MKALIVLSLISIFFCIQAVNVTELDDVTIKSFVRMNKYVVVYFYTPLCKHCKEFIPVFERAANASIDKKYPYVFAKIDGNQNFRARYRYNIVQFPTLILFVDGNAIPFTKDENSEQILEYLELKLRTKVKTIKSKKDLENVETLKGLRVNLHIYSLLVIGYPH